MKTPLFQTHWFRSFPAIACGEESKQACSGCAKENWNHRAPFDHQPHAEPDQFSFAHPEEQLRRKIEWPDHEFGGAQADDKEKLLKGGDSRAKQNFHFFRVEIYAVPLGTIQRLNEYKYAWISA